MKQTNASSWKLDTQLVHGGREHSPRGAQGVPTVQPIYASTTYLHQNLGALDQAFPGMLPSGEPAYVYARQGNPNAQSLENVMAQVEGGVGAVAFGSGMAAIHAAFLAAGLVPGSKLLAARDLYGSTIGLLRTTFVPAGVEIVFEDLCTPGAADIIRAEQQDIVFVETISNPLVKVTDLVAIIAAAREVDTVSIADSTFTTPYLVPPLEPPLDLVMHI